MPDLLIRDVPEPMRTEIRKAAASSGRSLSEEAKNLIRKGLAAPVEVPEPGSSAWDELRNAFGAAQLNDTEHYELLAATAQARKSAFRQSPEFE